MQTRLTGEMVSQLNMPFDPDLVCWKPGATNADKTRALALAYVGARAYQERLTEVAGADWSDDLEVLDGGAVVVCRLTIAGVTRCDIGEAAPSDQNTATSAAAQAFKRACVKFGLGAYLYSLPRAWVDYDAKRKQFTPGALAQLRAGLATTGEVLRYADGSPTNGNAAEVATFKAYTKEHGEPPANLRALRTWYQAAA